MGYIKPDKVIDTMVQAGTYKTGLTAVDILIRGFLSGGLLGFSTTLAYTAAIQTGSGIVGALVFPAGVAMIILLGLELVTSNFALVPAAVAEGKTNGGKLLYNWSLAFAGNLIGSVFYALLFYVVITEMGHVTDAAIIKKVVSVAETKTLGYKHLGAEGMLVAFASAVLCNWMVALGAVMSYTSDSATGKLAAMWLPVFTFFAQGYEHTVLNMFVIPAGILLGANVTIGDWWIWNQAPVLAGNIIGGMIFTGLALYATHSRYAFKKREYNKISTLIDELEVEHSKIYAMFDKAKELGVDSKDGLDRLLRAKSDLLEHLRKEDKEFYPALKRLAGKDESLKKSLETFAEETEKKSKLAMELLSKYTHGAPPSTDIMKDFSAIFSAFKERMGREEAMLTNIGSLAPAE